MRYCADQVTQSNHDVMDVSKGSMLVNDLAPKLANKESQNFNALRIS